MKSLIGKKIGMTSVFTEDGSSVACTLIEAGPCYVTSVKTKDNDGYDAVQLGFEERKEKGLKKPIKGMFKKRKLPLLRYLREVRDFDNVEELKIGSVLKADIFTRRNCKGNRFNKRKGFRVL
jgi:large subunit ribosomal protein L3